MTTKQSSTAGQGPTGIDAVLGKRSSAAAPPPQTVAGANGLRVDVEQLDNNPDQPRSSVDPDYIAELAESIRANGLAHPIAVRQIGERFQIVAGHCRRDAFRHLRERAPDEAGRAKWATIPAHLIEASDEQSALLCLLENIEREDLSPAEEGAAYARLQEKYGYATAGALAVRLGIEEQRVARRLRLQQGPEYLKDAVSRGIKVAPRDGSTTEGTPRRQETRKLTFEAALEFLRLHAYYQKKYPGLERGKADPRQLADLKGEPVVLKALAEGWSRQKIKAVVDGTIAGRAEPGDPDAAPRATAATPGTGALVERKADRLIVHLARLHAGTAEQRAAALEEIRLAVERGAA